MIRRWVFFVCSAWLCVNASGQIAYPLPSWNDSDAKREIVSFVEKVTASGTPDFVLVSDRIAVFDDDGTPWTEAPIPFQVAYALDEIARRAPNELRSQRIRW